MRLGEMKALLFIHKSIYHFTFGTRACARETLSIRICVYYVSKHHMLYTYCLWHPRGSQARAFMLVVWHFFARLSFRQARA